MNECTNVTGLAEDNLINWQTPTGTVVDAGIVVVENILRHQRMGKSRLLAAQDGAQEVAGAILAGTATTLA